MHKHRIKFRSIVPFSGPVADPQNRMAHGNLCQIDLCSCGAERRTNCNLGYRERGPWVVPLTASPTKGKQ